jgi:hypothetical protein
LKKLGHFTKSSSYPNYINNTILSLKALILGQQVVVATGLYGPFKQAICKKAS